MLTMREKASLTKAICERYQTASKLEKSKILNEFVQSCNYNRSYDRRILGQSTKLVKDGRKKKKKPHSNGFCCSRKMRQY